MGFMVVSLFQPGKEGIIELFQCFGLEKVHLVNELVHCLDCTGFAGHVEKTYNEVKGRVRNYEREQISQKV